MSRFTQVISKLTDQLRLEALTVGLDLGSLYTRVLVKDKLIYHQPTCLLKDHSTQSVLSFGRSAYDLYEKNPQGTQIIFPVKTGVVADDQALGEYLKVVLKQLEIKTTQQLLSLVKARVALPSGATQLDEKIMKRSLAEAGLGRVQVINNSRAIIRALKATKQLQDESNLIILDLGFAKTDLAVVIEGEIIYEQTLLFGSDRFNQIMLKQLRQGYQLLVSKRKVEELKRSLPDLFNQPSDHQLNLRGVDLENNLVKTESVILTSFAQEFQAAATELVDLLKLHLSQVEPASLVAAMEGGFVLTGGGSKLAGLAQYLAAAFQTPAKISSSAYTDTSLGLLL